MFKIGDIQLKKPGCACPYGRCLQLSVQIDCKGIRSRIGMR